MYIDTHVRKSLEEVAVNKMCQDNILYMNNILYMFLDII